MTLSEMADSGHEEVAFFRDDETGLECIVAIYDTRRGPAAGGTRMLDYDTEADALRDVLRLSRAMAYKTAAAGLPVGGGKAVVVGDPETAKTDDLLRAYGRVVDGFGGTFLTGEDVNVDADDLAVVGEETPYVGGGEAGTAVTALGVVAGIRASLAERHGDDSLDGATVLVQGCGKVGSALVERLVGAGASVKVADVDPAAVDAAVAAHGVEPVDPAAVYDEPCDVFAPCALGGVVNDDTVSRLRCDVVCGSANNVLEAPRHARALEERGIVYAPDYVVNAGGLIAGFVEVSGGSAEDARERAAGIRTRLEAVFETAREEGVTAVEAADRYAERRMAEGGDSLVV